jgi:hypothetical protein
MPRLGNNNLKGLLPWLAFGLSVLGAALGVSYKLFFSAADGASLQMEVGSHIKESDYIHDQQSITNLRILDKLEDIHKEQIEQGKDLSGIKVKVRARGWREERGRNHE